MSTKYIASNWRLPNKAGVNSYLNDNYGLTFDGSSELINCGTENIVTGKFTVSMWVKRNLTGGDSTQAFFSKADVNGSRTFSCFMTKSTGVLQFYVSNTGSILNNKRIATSDTITDENWHHLVFINGGDSGLLKIYIDGSEANLTTSGFTGISNLHSSSIPNIIGDSNVGNNDFSGSISELAVFDYSLSESQISTLYGSSSLGAGNPLALKPAPVAYYPLGDNSSGNPLTQPNEAVPDASVFDFVPNDYINIPDSDSLSFGDGANDSPFSISAWINVDDTTTNRIVSKTTSGNPEYLFTTGTAAMTLVLNLYDHPATVHSGPYRGKAGTTSFNSYIGQWVHVVATYDGRGGDTANDGINLYFNAALESTTNITAGDYFAMSNTSAPVRIGADPTWTNVYFDGQISNVQIWNTELSSSEVSTLYNSGVPLLTGTQPQASNLKAWYKLDQSANWDVSGSGYWDIPDASGNGNDGTSSGMTSANLVLTDLTRNLPFDSYSFSFDSASTDYIDCGNNNIFDITGDITLSGWVYSNSYSSANDHIISKDSVFILKANQAFVNKPRFQLNNGGFVTLEGPSQLPLNEWHHLVGVRDGNTMRLYINGVDIGTTATISGSLTVNTNSVLLGSYSTTQSIDGKLSNISVFNQALTSTEVLKLYSNGMPQDLSSFTPAPVAWWTLGSNSFFNGSNFICKDLKGSNDGTSVNAGVDALQGNTPRSEANGTGTNMDIPTNLEGTTKYSSNNSWSINMSESARVADTP